MQSFAKEKDTNDDFQKLVTEQKKTWNAAVRLNDLFWPLVELASGIATVVVLAVGYKLVTKGEIEIGTLIAFSMYAGMFWRPIMNLSSFYNTLITNLSAADRIFDILDVKPGIVHVCNAKKIGEIQGMIEFKNVSFAYEEGN